MDADDAGRGAADAALFPSTVVVMDPRLRGMTPERFARSSDGGDYSSVTAVPVAVTIIMPSFLPTAP